jgi:predicted XRE-type DNA-binding protein
VAKWEVEEHGSRVRHFISGLTDVRAFDEAAALIKLVRERGNRLRKPRSAPLGGGLFELRGEQVRIFTCSGLAIASCCWTGWSRSAMTFRTMYLSGSGSSRERSDNMAKDFMGWLDREIGRRGREKEVAAQLNEMMVEEQLANLRRKRGLSQAKLAELMNVKQPLIARIEAGRVKNLTLNTIVRSAAALGARVELRFKPALAIGRRKRTQTPR